MKFRKATLDEMFTSLKKLSSFKGLVETLGISPTTLKKWRGGAITIPSSSFEKLTKSYPHLKVYLSQCKNLPSYWGQSKGGKKFTRSLSKETLKKRMESVRGNRKILRAITTDVRSPEALEFLGVMIGDGCISEYLSGEYIRREVRISGNSLKDKRYFLEYLAPLIEKLFGISVNPRIRKTSNTIDIQIINAVLFNWLRNNGFPVGKKGQIRIPDPLVSLTKNELNNLIRGIFDTDGAITARKDENYRYPYIYISSNSTILREQIKQVLREQGIPAYFHDIDVVVRGKKNFEKWFDNIKSSNPRNISRYEEYLKTGMINCSKGS